MQHRLYQTFPVNIAFNGNAQNMNSNQYQSKIGKEFMHFFPEFLMIRAYAG